MYRSTPAKHRLRGRIAPLFLVVLLSGFVSLDALFAPKAELWQRWLAEDPTSQVVVDHAAWDRFLNAYVRTDSTGLNRVAYGDVSKTDKAALADYVTSLGTVAVSRLARSEQLAFWINVYNALTIQLVVDHYPLASITDIDLGGGGLFSSGPWARKIFKVEDEQLSLNDIEHRILRPIWKDPRLHYAVNCASIGCPNLQAVAYTGALAPSMLEDAATAFVNAPRNIRLADGKLSVSRIYSWFQKDFGGTETRVLDHLRIYARPDLYAKLEAITGISGYTYDWALNGTKE